MRNEVSHSSIEIGRHSGLYRLLLSTFTVLGLFFTSGCASNPAASFSSIQDFNSQVLKWSSCEEDFECAHLLVPIDYTNFEIGSFKIALLRYKAQDKQKRIGSLVLNPGGPGGSGIDYALSAPYLFDAEILDSYDIVGFDPRGVGKSAAIRCLNDAETDENYAEDSKPDNEEEFVAQMQSAKDFAAKCTERNKFLTHFSSAETARDMDILRAALGDKKLNYVGKSYGTYLGTLYAQFFPDKVGRMILDGAIDPNVPVLEQNISQAVGFETALSAFLKNCATLPDCPLPKDEIQARDALTSLFEKAAVNPLPMKNSDKRVATESLIVLGTASALYEDTYGWKQLRKAIAQAKEGSGDLFIGLADMYADRGPDGRYISNQLDSGAVIDCLDWHDMRSDEELQADAALFKERAPLFGPYLAYTGMTCKYMPQPKPDSLTRKTNKIKSIVTTPIIVVGTLRDPATPYQWAVGLQKIFKNSVLITLDADGHTGEGRGSKCVDQATNKYLLTGIAPQENLSCTL